MKDESHKDRAEEVERALEVDEDPTARKPRGMINLKVGDDGISRGMDGTYLRIWFVGITLSGVVTPPPELGLPAGVAVAIDQPVDLLGRLIREPDGRPSLRWRTRIHHSPRSFDPHDRIDSYEITADHAQAEGADEAKLIEVMREYVQRLITPSEGSPFTIEVTENEEIEVVDNNVGAVFEGRPWFRKREPEHDAAAFREPGET